MAKVLGSGELFNELFARAFVPAAAEGADATTARPLATQPAGPDHPHPTADDTFHKTTAGGTTSALRTGGALRKKLPHRRPPATGLPTGMKPRIGILLVLIQEMYYN